MRSNMTIYEGAFVNQETNANNENIQQIISVRLFDTETAVGDTPFGVTYRVTNNGDGTQTVVINWGELPVAAVSASFGYDNGVDVVDTVVGLTGPATIIIPEGDYVYSFFIDYEIGTDPRYQLGEGNIIDLEMGETPLVFSVVDNAEDKFTPVKSKQAEIQIHSSNTIDISKFSEGGDNRFYVEIESQAEGIIFKGFLSISDLSQEFLPDPNIITLTATDGLGFLNDEPLVNFEGETPTGPQKIISFLVWALAKTGLSLDVKACMNIREHFAVPLVSDDSGAGHFYNYIYLDPRTFEEEIGVCEDCFTVLEKILGENSFLTQYKGKWVIMRVDEFEADHDYYFTRFNHLGEWQENTEESFSKSIGAGYSLSFMNDDAEVSLDRPYKSIKETFKYTYPEELVCNIDFERGEVRTEPDLAAETSEGIYELDCWTKQKFPPTGTAILPADNDAHIKRTFEYGYEKQRYVVLTAGPAAALEGIMSQPMYVNEKDKITISVDWRLASNVGSGDGVVAVKVLNILLLTDDGDYYYVERLIDADPPIWQGPFSGQNNTSVNFSWHAGDTNETEWQNIEVSPPILPVSGRLFIGLFKEWQGPGVYEVDTYYSNLTISIIPLINGSYRKYTGQEHTVSQDNNNIKAIRENEVFISDAPRIAMKGALLKQGAGQTIYTGEVSFGSLGQFEMSGDFQGSFSVGAIISISGSAGNNLTGTIIDVNYSIVGDLTTVYTDQTTTTEVGADVVITQATYVLSGLFYNAAKQTGGPGSQGDLMPYGQIQAFDIWNQFNRVMVKFEATIDKTDSTTELPDLIHKYIVRDVSNLTTNGGDQFKIFQLLHFEMNMHMCEWGCFLHEVYDTTKEKRYEGNSFKYITNE